MEPEPKEENQEGDNQSNEEESDVQLLLKSDEDMDDVKGTHINFAEAAEKSEEREEIKPNPNLVELSSSDDKSKDNK